MTKCIVKFDALAVNRDYRWLALELFNNDPNIPCVYDFLRPLTDGEVDNLFKRVPGRYFSLYETNAEREKEPKRHYVGIAGFVDWRENRCGARLFVSIRDTDLRSMPHVFESALKYLLSWYFKNTTREFLYMERLSGDIQQSVFESIHAEVLGKGKLFFSGKVCDTVQYLINRQ